MRGRRAILGARFAAAALAGGVGVPHGGAQETLARRATASSPTLELAAVERRLFDATRRSPRNPVVRQALGEWLASRGQLRAGAVLLEEARLFGGAAPTIAARLQHLYRWLADWPSLAALPASPLAAGEHRRAEVLAGRETQVVGADSTLVPFAPLEVGALGRLPLVLGTDTLWAELDPQAEGIVLPGLARGAGLVDVVGAGVRGPIGVLREAAIGDLRLRNLPVDVDTTLGAGRAHLGFDVFAMLAPTVNARAGTVMLRREGVAVEPLDAAGIPLLLGFPGVRLALRAGEAAVPMAAPAGRAALRGHQWTVDLRRGVVWVDGAR